MSEITVQVSDRERQLLDERARECGMTSEQFAHLTIASAIESEDGDFEQIKEYLFEKYEDLYRRLA
ncbi:MAG: hypothetical protein Q8922_01095 [Bacteroidota bacterium]|nr:hypothetical protein [Bacteroidota bacterium]MDP4232176.1 hypothetical protein [Bacteroidota bacterium]MDP4241116.1 hypothetical protein [Bacteroidota bacterium]MDP4286508.1 hypothetical protein [Bacteroidota bacterium]